MANNQQVKYAGLDNTGEDGGEEATASGQGTTASPSLQQPAMTAQPMMVQQPMMTAQQPTVQPQPMMVQQPMMTVQQPMVQQPMMTAQQPTVQQPMMMTRPPMQPMMTVQQPMMATGLSPVAMQYMPQAGTVQFVSQPVQPQTQVGLVQKDKQREIARFDMHDCKHGVQ